MASSELRRAVFAPTFEAWREAARPLLAAAISPEAILWSPADDEQPTLDGLADLSSPSTLPRRGIPAPTRDLPIPADSPASAQLRVPRRYVELAEAAACHADGERWALLYRVLWRIARGGERHLMDVAVDPDVHRLLRMEKAVRREIHKMHAFVRFRGVVDDAGEAHWVAWFEPAHPVVERAAPFFAVRFASMRWSILTPQRCVHWNGDALAFTPGLPRSAAPAGDELEALWRTYYASTFNPARVRTNAMRAEMPIRYWRNLPEAAQIGELVRDAPARVRRMVERAET